MFLYLRVRLNEQVKHIRYNTVTKECTIIYRKGFTDPVIEEQLDTPHGIIFNIMMVSNSCKTIEEKTFNDLMEHYNLILNCEY